MLKKGIISFVNSLVKPFCILAFSLHHSLGMPINRGGARVKPLRPSFTCLHQLMSFYKGWTLVNPHFLGSALIALYINNLHFMGEGWSHFCTFDWAFLLVWFKSIPSIFSINYHLKKVRANHQISHSEKYGCRCFRQPRSSPSSRQWRAFHREGYQPVWLPLHKCEHQA